MYWKMYVICRKDFDLRIFELYLLLGLIVGLNCVLDYCFGLLELEIEEYKWFVDLYYGLMLLCYGSFCLYFYLMICVDIVFILLKEFFFYLFFCGSIKGGEYCYYFY